MPIRVLAVAVEDDDELARLVAAADGGAFGDVALVAVGPVGPAPRGRLVVDPAALGLAGHEPEVVAVVAALAGAFPREVAVAARAGAPLAEAGRVGGAAVLTLAPDGTGADAIAAALAERRAADADARHRVGVGPHPEPWPDNPRLDPALLAAGDRRNVIDRYRYWREDAIVADLDRRRHPVHVAVENWRHDLNIGTVVRNANAFNVASVHVVGERRWNRRGAMATDRYLTVHHHPTVGHLVAWAAAQHLPIVGIDNVPGARDLDAAPLPAPAVLLFGQEGPGLSVDAREACTEVVAIAQHGSTRSLNAGVASGIALHAWVRDHGTTPPAWPERPSVP